MIIFNKIDAYTWVEKEADDLTPRTKENIPLDELIRTWMAKLNDNCLFISATQRENVEALKEALYTKVREMHVQKYPYNDFLFDTYDTNGEGVNADE
jgi:GTP-binding protein HflX